ncbi:hypothetical protein BDY19DRAFT_499934 [Irpex rosettiformis]|uniref:Uncharacterized protein n=1 Tax=Irpex rosettiformis TaxID=378272 RepID=A0ACB8UED4_9APHY|nr:hypothetical protein BDY19DRAFT_499934 [Irpex rosettiformis]
MVFISSLVVSHSAITVPHRYFYDSFFFSSSLVSNYLFGLRLLTAVGCQDSFYFLCWYLLPLFPLLRHSCFYFTYCCIYSG